MLGSYSISWPRNLSNKDGKTVGILCFLISLLNLQTSTFLILGFPMPFNLSSIKLLLKLSMIYWKLCETAFEKLHPSKLGDTFLTLQKFVFERCFYVLSEVLGNNGRISTCLNSTGWEIILNCARPIPVSLFGDDPRKAAKISHGRVSQASHWIYSPYAGNFSKKAVFKVHCLLC